MLRTCPVRFLTAEAAYVLGLFQRCYNPTVVGFGGVTWQRVALPHEGAMADQDAWLMAALEYLKDEHNALEAEAAKRKPTKKDPATSG